MAAAKKVKKPVRKLPTASPRPEKLGMGSQSSGFQRHPAPPKKEPKPPDFRVMGPKTLQYYRQNDGVGHALVWEERELHKEGEGKLTKFEIRVKCWHVLFTGDAGQPAHKILTRAEAHHPATLTPTMVRTTPEAFEEYLRDRARRFGAPVAVYRVLGMEPPAHDPASLPESQAAHEEMYQRAAKHLGTSVEDLRKKYGHLNPGLQQMNLRNRLRAKGVNV